MDPDSDQARDTGMAIIGGSLFTAAYSGKLVRWGQGGETWMCRNGSATIWKLAGQKMIVARQQDLDEERRYVVGGGGGGTDENDGHIATYLNRDATPLTA